MRCHVCVASSCLCHVIVIIMLHHHGHAVVSCCCSHGHVVDGTNWEVLANEPSDNTSMMTTSHTCCKGMLEGEANNVNSSMKTHWRSRGCEDGKCGQRRTKAHTNWRQKEKGGGLWIQWTQMKEDETHAQTCYTCLRVGGQHCLETCTANVDRGRWKHTWTGGGERKGDGCESTLNTGEGGWKHIQVRDEQTGVGIDVVGRKNNKFPCWNSTWSQGVGVSTDFNELRLTTCCSITNYAPSLRNI